MSKRVIQGVVGVMLVLAVAVLMLNRDRLHVYQIYFTEKLPEVNMQFQTLSAEMDEAALRQHFQGVALDCFNQPRQFNGLGDRVCYAYIGRADGQAALTLAMFSNNGRLSHALVQIPWWAHGGMVSRMVAQYGKANRDGRIGGYLGGPVVRWNLPKGHLTINRDRQINPLGWSVILWTASGVQP